MRKIRYRYLLTLILIIVAGAWIIIKQQHAKQNANTVTVSTVVATQKKVTIPVSAVGYVEPIAAVALTARVDGELIATYFHSGDDVKAGQLLFQIDPRPYQVQLDVAKANLARDQALLVNAQNTLTRNQTLVKGGYVAAQQFDTYETDVASKKAIVAADQASVDDATLQLAFTSIHAPISGRTGDILVKPGNLIKNANAQVLVQINQLAPIDVRFSIPEKKLLHLRQATDVKNIPVSVKAGGKRITREDGQLSFIDNEVDNTTGMITLKATFANSQLDLWPGEFVHVSLPLYTLPKAIVIPTRAIQAGQRGPFVFVINKGVAQSRDIQVGPALGDFSVIQQGLKAGEVVVLEGQLNITDGTPVKIKDAAR